jgi:hypothetical protein
VLKESENAAIEPTSRYSNAVILRGKTQYRGKTQDQADQKSSHSCESVYEDDKFKERKCVCDDVHLFKECLYIVNAARKPG